MPALSPGMMGEAWATGHLLHTFLATSVRCRPTSLPLSGFLPSVPHGQHRSCWDRPSLQALPSFIKSGESQPASRARDAREHLIYRFLLGLSCFSSSSKEPSEAQRASESQPAPAWTPPDEILLTHVGNLLRRCWLPRGFAGTGTKNKENLFFLFLFCGSKGLLRESVTCNLEPRCHLLPLLWFAQMFFSRLQRNPILGTAEAGSRLA